MTIQAWLDAAIQDADQRELPALRPVLRALASSTAALRSAAWNEDAADKTSSVSRDHGR